MDDSQHDHGFGQHQQQTQAQRHQEVQQVRHPSQHRQPEAEPVRPMADLVDALNTRTATFTAGFAFGVLLLTQPVVAALAAVGMYLYETRLNN